MADFKKLAKGNPLKPKHVTIPQLDPIQDLMQYNAPGSKKPTLASTISPTKPQAPTAEPMVELQPETDDMASYKDKYLRKEDEKETKTFRFYKRRIAQMEKEQRETGLSPWQIIDIGLEMYFRDKQGVRQK